MTDTLIFTDRAADAALHLLEHSALSGPCTWRIGEYGELHVDPLPGYASTGERLLFDVLAAMSSRHPVDLSKCAWRLDQHNAAAVHTALGLLLGTVEVAAS